MPTGTSPKGKYDVFYAFAVEYPAILCDLRRSGDIITGTFLSVKDENLEFIAFLYFNYVIRKRPCSYDLSSCKESVEVFYDAKQLNAKVRKEIANRFVNKLKGLRMRGK